MKKRTYFSFKFFGIGFFLFAFLFVSFSFAQSSDNLNKLNLPFKVDFTTAEAKFLNSLSPTDLEKLIRVIKLIIERNKSAQANKVQDLTSNTQTIYSNTQTTQTPYYNSATGQYQSKPATFGPNGENATNINQANQNSNPYPSNNPYSNNLPYSGQSTSAYENPYTSTSPQNSFINGLAQGISDTSQVSCKPKNGSHTENAFLFQASGIKHKVTSGFGGLPVDTALMLKEIETDCNCKILVTSASRANNPTSANTEHGIGKRVVDLAYESTITNYIKTKGVGSGCRYTIKGVKFLDEKTCPTSAATGPHWHVNGNNWACKK